MKNFIKLTTAAAFLLFLISSMGNAQIGIGFHLGLSTPNDQVNNVYNSSTLNLEGGLSRLLREGPRLGYHLGMRARLPLSNSFIFTGGIGWHRFPQTEIDVRDPQNPDNILITLKTIQNIIPIAAGFNYYLLSSGIGVYGTGELTYNFISSSVDIPKGDITIPGTTTPSDSRVGFGLGAGVDLDIQLLLLNLEAKYNMANLIGQESGEQAKAYWTLTLGVYFGSASPKGD